MKWMILQALVLNWIISAAAGDTDDDRVTTKTIPEETAAGSVVAEMARILSIRYSERQNRQFKLLRQTLVTVNPNSEEEDVKYLTLDPDTGEITTSQTLDRETLCEKAEKCVIRLKAVMLPNEYFTIVNLEVVIEDINDNMPEFLEKTIAIHIKEGDYETGDAISLDRYAATDKDIGVNGELSYDLESNAYFAIATQTDDVGVSHLQLRVLAPPDHEETRSMDLILTATDNGVDRHSATTTLNIRIADANDNSPIFEKQEYLIKLKENEGPPHVVATVHAADKDSGRYGTVRYFLPPASKQNDRSRRLAAKLFSINERTGEIKLRKKVDREIYDGLRTLVEAQDSDPVSPRIGKAWLHIQVEDVNDNAPIIKINFIVDSHNLTGYIPESATIKTYVADLTVSDADDGANGDVTTTITTFGKYRSRKALEKLDDQFVLANGLLSTGRHLDREAFQYYVVQITSCDGGRPSARCSSLNATIIVLDENDNPPVFDATEKSVMIAEDSAVGSFVLNVKAADSDALYPPSKWKNKMSVIEDSRNGIVRYSIVEGSTEYFEVDEASGDIRLRNALDREKTKEWKLVIEARDEGWEISSKANCTVFIRVSDVNDNSPVFIEPQRDEETVFATIIREQVIMIVKASDSDAAANSMISYKIVEQDGEAAGQNASDISLFIIDPSSGELKLNFSKSNLTDLLGLHTLSVAATDSGEPPKSSTRYFNVHIIDEEIPEPSPESMFDKTYILLAIALGVASLILIIAITVIVVCRRRKDKKMHTYDCRSAEKTTNAWISEPVEVDNSKTGSRPFQTGTLTSLGPESPKKVIHINERALRMSSQARNQRDQNKMTTFKTESKPSATAVVLSSLRAVDRDSGRGDSDSENGNFGHTDYQGATQSENVPKEEKNSSIQTARQRDNESMRTSELGPQCQEDCLTKGHSDVCWMPRSTSTNTGASTQPSRGLKYGLTASAPRLDTPSYYDYDRGRNTNEYPTLQHVPSRPHSRQSDYYRTMSFSPSRMVDHYHQNFDGELQPIDEMIPLNPPMRTAEEMPYEGDDVSAQTQLTLSTSPRPTDDNRERFMDAASRASFASSLDYLGSSQQRQNWDSRYNIPPKVQRRPLSPNNYVEFTQERTQYKPHMARVQYPRQMSSSSEQSFRYAGHDSRRPGSATPYDPAYSINNPNYYNLNGSMESTGQFPLQRAHNVNSMFT